MVDRPGARHVDLLEQVAPEPVTRIDHPARRRVVLQEGLGTLALGLVRVPLVGKARVPVLVGVELDLGHDVGRRAIAHGLVRQRDARILEVERLPEGSAQVLATAARVQQAGGDADADLVRVPDPVRTDVAVGAEQLHQVQVGNAGVENRQVILVLVRHVQVQHPWLERLNTLALRAGLTLHGETRVEAGRRQRAIR